ncbi:hypothetical protein [Prolixibacter sp. SD074]|jgi:hypothetical protein|uniref:hypothetical protein n=1 Tax=Prolixibacter sp. SD074 TaxID=2652391 RepID=UPI001276DDAC|nr:hypothetical protein [Prolixibacter sp. SD074]GET30828.1 hypothetical protein SD074_30300 [Prolixibacter sp. SD074]
MKNKLTGLIIVLVLVLAGISCNNQEEGLLKLENGLYIQVFLKDAFNSLEVYPPKADFDAEITLVRSDGAVTALNYPIFMTFQDGRYISRLIPIPPADYRLTKFTVRRMGKVRLIPAPHFAVTYPINSTKNCTFHTSAVGRTLLSVSCLSLSYLGTHAESGSGEVAQAAEVSGFYLFINRCNDGNRENFHEVLSYNFTAYTSDGEQNPVTEISSGNNLNSQGHPEPVYISLPADYTNGIVLQVQPIGEENSVLIIPITKVEIEKYVNGEIDFVHLEIGCD